jgi:hypothetical protein
MGMKIVLILKWISKRYANSDGINVKDVLGNASDFYAF